MKAIRLSFIRDDKKTVDYLITEDAAGDVQIVDERSPRLDADRRVCVWINGVSVILSVDKAVL